MDEKKAREILDREITKLKDVSLTSTNSCMIALYLSISDKAVQDVFLQKIGEGNLFKGMHCLPGIGISERRRVEFKFDCPSGVFCLIPPSFLVIVDIVERKVEKIVDPYLGIDPNFNRSEGMSISSDGDVGWFAQPQAMGDGYMGWGRVVANSDGYFPWGPQRSTVNPMGDGMIGWGRNSTEGYFNWLPTNPQHFVEIQNIQIQITGHGQAVLLAEIKAPNGCYHMGCPSLQAPPDIMTVPEQLTATIPVFFIPEAACTKAIQTFRYQLPFNYTEGQSSLNVFFTVNGKITGQKVLTLSQASLTSSSFAIR